VTNESPLLQCHTVTDGIKLSMRLRLPVSSHNHHVCCLFIRLIAWLFQMEMERALLDGEQQIQLEQLEAAKEKVASLEAKETRLLAEATDERAKVFSAFVCIIFKNLMYSKLQDTKICHIYTYVTVTG